MAKFTRIEVATKMKKMGIVPIFYHSDIEIAKKVLKACYDGGAHVVEFTNRGEFAHEVFGELNKYAHAELPNMALGIGSLTDAGTASLYLQLGANFVVTPVLREDIAIVCNRKKVLWSPGCGSLGEIARAEEMGCEIIKLFPGGTYGPEFVAAIRGPQPWTSIMPTGGVEPTEDNLSKWFNAGVYCVGMGSQLITKDIIKNNNFAQLKKNVKDTIALVQRLRSVT